MARLTRRFILAAAAVSAASSALPRPLVSATEVPAPAKKVAWVVGTPGEYNWEVIRAKTKVEAIRLWNADNCEHEYEVDENGKPDRPCECIACAWEINASRVPEFDKIARPTPGDWLRAGIGHTCSRCGYETDPQNTGNAIGDEAVCEDCLTTAESAAISAASTALSNGEPK